MAPHHDQHPEGLALHLDPHPLMMTMKSKSKHQDQAVSNTTYFPTYISVFLPLFWFIVCGFFSGIGFHRILTVMPSHLGKERQSHQYAFEPFIECRETN